MDRVERGAPPRSRRMLELHARVIPGPTNPPENRHASMGNTKPRLIAVQLQARRVFTGGVVACPDASPLSSETAKMSKSYLLAGTHEDRTSLASPTPSYSIFPTPKSRTVISQVEVKPHDKKNAFRGVVPCRTNLGASKPHHPSIHPSIHPTYLLLLVGDRQLREVQRG